MLIYTNVTHNSEIKRREIALMNGRSHSSDKRVYEGENVALCMCYYEYEKYIITNLLQYLK